MVRREFITLLCGAVAACTSPESPRIRLVTLSEFKSEYEDLWQRMTIRPERLGTVSSIARNAIAAKTRYQSVEKKNGVPWFVIASLHYRESNANFSRYLGNGEPFNRMTRSVPQGRGPFSSWDEGAIDALKINLLDTVTEWTMARTCFQLEKFNGFDYRNQGIHSPYLWSYTNHYTRGKYIGDKEFDGSAVDPQCGAMPLIKRIMELDRGASFAGETLADAVPAPSRLPSP